MTTPAAPAAPKKPFIHPGADVADDAVIGAATKVWNRAQLAAGVVVGSQCVIAVGVSLGSGTRIGDRVKIQINCGVFGAVIEDGVILAPNVLALEDPAPRAVNPDGTIKTAADWVRKPVTVRTGASVGANAVLLPGTVVGEFAMIGAGSVVGRIVPAHALVLGNPARQVGWVCYCAIRLDENLTCPDCHRRFATCPDSEAITEITNDHEPAT